MKKIYWILIVSLIASPFLIIFVLLNTQNSATAYQQYDEKVYVALEAEGRVGVIDTKTKKVIASIDLSDVQNGTRIKYTAHNVQVSPDGKSVLVTANVDRGSMSTQEPSETAVISDEFLDKVFIIDPITDSVSGSIPIGIDTHLAHIILNGTSQIAYVTLQEKGQVYALDMGLKKISKIFDLGDTSEPHGLRILPNNSRLLIALIGTQSIAATDPSTGATKYFPLSGAVVQTAVTPDGRYVFATVYESKKVAWIDTQTNTQGYINLPVNAKGPVQLYTTPDSKYVYVADQGYYFEQPTGNSVYRIDIAQKQVDQIIAAGMAPHGLVVSKDGTFVYVTNLLSEDVSVIDTTSNTEVDRISVGKMPNGISIWHKELGGTP